MKQTSKNNNQNKDDINTSVFDNTLREIEQTLENLGQKIELERDLLKSPEIKKEFLNENTEHIIDGNHLSLETLHNYKEEVEIKKKKLGFYGYLVLTIVIFFVLYKILNISKEFIVSKYPATEPTIQYFYETVEVLDFLRISIFSFIKNLIQIT